MKARDFFENFIMAAIVCAIVHTFLYEFGIFSHWNVSTRYGLIVAGFFFDLVFTIEFTVRSLVSGRKRLFSRYFLFERGWVDFLSSVPLLLFDSGPSTVLLLTGTYHESASLGVLMVLKVVKAIRVTRILRLVRIIKIFGKIHNAESKMAQHHTAVISTTAVFTIVCALILMSVLTDSSGFHETEKRRTHYERLLAKTDLCAKDKKERASDSLLKLFSDDDLVLRVYQDGAIVHSVVPVQSFGKIYGPDDYIKAAHGESIIHVSIVDIHRSIALSHIESFFIIILVVLSIMIIYTRHFAQNISDITHILGKGLRKRDYNLQIKIRDEFSEDEIYQLARFYNDTYLPAKIRKLHEEEEKKSGLSMNDLMSFTQK